MADHFDNVFPLSTGPSGQISGAMTQTWIPLFDNAQCLFGAHYIAALARTARLFTRKALGKN